MTNLDAINPNGEYQYFRVKRDYSDPSAAHEAANKFKNHGAYSVRIEPGYDQYPAHPKYTVFAWFKTHEEAKEALRQEKQ